MNCLGRPRVNPIKVPRDDLNRQGRRIGDGNKKLKYNFIQRCQETGQPLHECQFATLNQIAQHLDVTRDCVSYMMRGASNFSRHHNKHLKFIEISKI